MYGIEHNVYLKQRLNKVYNYPFSSFCHWFKYLLSNMRRGFQGPLLHTWFNFNPSADKYLHQL